MIYLASRSPQRAMLLSRASVPFTVVASACDEEAITAPVPQALAIERARGKARGARDVPARAVVLGADTVVALGQKVLGSPADAAANRAMLQLLSGTTHQVLTAHCLVRFGANGPEAEAVALSTARVTMRLLSPAEIDAYVATGEGLGKAGGYAIQAQGDRFVVEVQGATETVIGLHVPTVAKLWREVGEGPLPGYTGSSPSSQMRVVR